MGCRRILSTAKRGFAKDPHWIDQRVTFQDLGGALDAERIRIQLRERPDGRGAMYERKEMCLLIGLGCAKATECDVWELPR